MNDDFHIEPTVRLAPDLELPERCALGRTVLLGRTGQGKSTASQSLVAQIIDRGHRVVVLDPTGDWSRGHLGPCASGRLIPIVADEAADHELPGLVQEPANFVFDLSSRRGSNLADAGATLLDALFTAADGHPTVVVVEEAHELGPQRPTSAAHRDSLWAFERIACRGRSRGLGVVAVTQRSAEISKTILSQLDTLIVFASPLPNDRRAITEWVPGDSPANRKMLADLATLAVGEALVWRPAANALSRHRLDPAPNHLVPDLERQRVVVAPSGLEKFASADVAADRSVGEVARHATLVSEAEHTDVTVDLGIAVRELAAAVRDLASARRLRCQCEDDGEPGLRTAAGRPVG